MIELVKSVNFAIIGAWPSGLGRSLWEAEVVGSNPTAPMRVSYNGHYVSFPS